MKCMRCGGGGTLVHAVGREALRVRVDEGDGLKWMQGRVVGGRRVRRFGRGWAR